MSNHNLTLSVNSMQTNQTVTVDDKGKWNSAANIIKNGKLSIVMPVHNLEQSIKNNIKTVRDTFSGKVPFEIIAVNDGSSDNTARELSDVAHSVPELKVVNLAYNSGKGAALKSGFRASTGHYILMLDGDLDLPPQQTPKLFDIMQSTGADIVIGSKMHPDSEINYPLQRRIMSRAYYFIVKVLIGLPVHDTQTGIKLFKRNAIQFALDRMLVKEFAFDLEVLAIAHSHGYKIAEAPVKLDFQMTWGFVRPKSLLRIITDTLAIFYRIKVLKYYQTIKDNPSFSENMLVSIIIACPAPTKYLDECLAGIQRQTYANYEVIILPDSASGKVWSEKIREIPTGPTRPAEKRNKGIQEAKGSIIAFIDDDAQPMADWLEHAVVYFSRPEIGAVGGPAITPPDELYMAKLGGLVYSNLLVSGKYRYRYEVGRVQESDDIPSCNLIVRADIAHSLGGFKTEYWPGEDTYMCLEIVHRLKKKMMYDPRIQVVHHRRSLFLPHLRQVGRYAMHRGYFAKKFPENSRRLAYMIPSLFVIGLIAGAIASYFAPVLRIPYMSCVIVYLFLTLLFSCNINPVTWIIVWLGVMLTHITYGIRFIVGLLANSMPGEVKSFDHPSEDIKT